MKSILSAYCILQIVACSNFPTDEDISKNGDFGGIFPLVYRLALHFNAPYGPQLSPEESVHYSGWVKLFFQVTEPGVDKIYLHSAENLKIYSAYLYDGPSIIKLRVNSTENDMIRFNLNYTLTRQLTYTIEVGFAGQIREDRGIFYKYRQNYGEKNATWAITTLFQLRNARTAFPCMDHPMLKATFHLCLYNHDKENHAPNGHQGLITLLSNTNDDVVRRTNETGRQGFCFQGTPIIPTYVLSFALLYNYEVRKSSSGFPVRIYFPTESQLTTADEIIKDTQTLVSDIENYMKMSIPVKEITLILHQQMPENVQGIENLGMISLDINQYQRYGFYGKRILAHELLHQWIGNTFTITSWDDVCLQEGITTYLDFKISNDSLGNDMAVSLEQAKDQGMRSEKLENQALIRKFDQLADVVNNCYGKPPVIISTIAGITGEEKFRTFVRRLTKKFKYKNLKLTDWLDTLSVATEPETSAALKHYFSQAGYPVIFVRKLNSNKYLEVSLDQAMIKSEKQTGDKFLGNLPFKFECEDRHSRSFVINQFPSSIGLERNRNNSWTVLDSRPYYYRVVYDIELYQRVANCTKAFDVVHCPSDGLINNLVNDLEWGLQNQILPLNGDDTAEKYLREILTSLYRPA